MPGVYRNGKVTLDASPDWPEGLKVEVVPNMVEREHDDYNFPTMTEEEQSDDPTAIRKWIEDVSAIPPLDWSDEEIAAIEAWRDKVKAFNIEAVRKQFMEGTQ